jgi:DNA-directed RNA polymerase specialized sigma24 family protein
MPPLGCTTPRTPTTWSRTASSARSASRRRCSIPSAWAAGCSRSCTTSISATCAAPGTTIGLDALADDLALSAPPEDRNQIRDFARAMATLSDDHRQILLLVSLEGLSYREIAVLLEVPIGTVMSRLARARERLRIALEGGDDQMLRRVP